MRKPFIDMSPKIIDKEAKKREILHAAMLVFAEHGVAQTKVAEIARRAGIGKGTIYEYFRSKEDMFIEAFHAFMHEMELSINSQLEQENDPRRMLEAVFKISAESFLQAGDFARIMMDFWAEGIRNSNKEEVDRLIDLHSMYGMYRNQIAEILEMGIVAKSFKKVEVHHLSCALVGWLDGVFLQWFIAPKEIDVRASIDAFMDTLFYGILANEAREIKTEVEK